ncbi:hypothetical protein E2542_SST07072 [Spatholobus suberectus]|nr:hypothetical protein E2542_SST07072 [Spatholobus suberectus]
MVGWVVGDICGVRVEGVGAGEGACAVDIAIRDKEMASTSMARVSAMVAHGMDRRGEQRMVWLGRGTEYRAMEVVIGYIKIRKFLIKNHSVFGLHRNVPIFHAIMPGIDT